MDATQLLELKAELKKHISEIDFLAAIENAKQQLPPHSAKFNILVQLERQYKELQLHRIKGVVSFEQWQLEQSKLNANLLALVDILDEYDFAQPAASSSATPARGNKTGSVLYAIPSRMQLQKEKKCVVRLSFDEKYLLENYFNTGSDTHIKSIRRIEERMEVELIDPNEEQVFAVRAINNTLQKVEKDDYTEWLFFVKPLVEGTFELWLKVTVVMKAEDGTTDKKEIVLQENIEVVTHATAGAGVEMRHSGLIFSIGGGAALAAPGDANDSAIPNPSGAAKGFWESTTGKISAVAGVAALVGGLWYSGVLDTGGSQTDGHFTASSAEARFASVEFKSPLSGVEVPTYAFIINPNRDTVIQLPSGTTFIIPAGSIADQSGQLVTEQVEIQVREFRKAHEIIASGISMRLPDSDDKAQWMQTAGMFEVQGYCNGKKVALAEGKSIRVSLISDVDGAYDFWVLDSQSGNWENKGATPSPERVNAAPSPILQKEIRELKAMTKIRPFKPRVYEKHAYKKEEIIVDCCPELQKEQVLTLTFAGTDPADALENNTWMAAEELKNTWLKPKLLRSSIPNHYIMKFRSSANKVFETEVKLAGTDDFSHAQARYDSLNKIYQQNIALLQQKETIAAEQAQFRRSIEVQGFGVYNYDILWKKGDAIPVLADFNFGPEFEPIKNQVTVYLVTGNSRAVAALPYQDWHSFRFSPSSDNKLLAILPGNKLAVFTQKDFSSQMKALKKAKDAAYTFRMRVLDRPADSLADLEHVLKEADELL